MGLNALLGYKPDEKLLLVNGDDFGMCHAANEGIHQLLAEQRISSATLMVPCPWSTEAANIAVSRPDFNIGVHLTLTSEWSGYKWGPVQRAGSSQSLVTAAGWFPATCLEVEQRADAGEVLAELRSQVERAIQMGVDPTHLDSHMGSVYGLASGRDFLEETLQVCEEFGLPLRLPRNLDEREAHMPDALIAMYKERVASADRRGILLIDHLTGPEFQLAPGEAYADVQASMIRMLQSLQPGVTEIIIHPFLDTDELKAITPTHWQKRKYEFNLFRDEAVIQAMESAGIKLINWRQLRDAQRAQRAT